MCDHFLLKYASLQIMADAFQCNNIRICFFKLPHADQAGVHCFSIQDHHAAATSPDPAGWTARNGVALFAHEIHKRHVQITRFRCGDSVYPDCHRPIRIAATCLILCLHPGTRTAQSGTLRHTAPSRSLQRAAPMGVAPQTDQAGLQAGDSHRARLPA